MILSLNINQLFFLILFLLSMFIGSIRFPFGPVRLDLIAGIGILLFFLVKNRTVNKKILIKLLPFTFFIMYFLLHIVFNISSIQIRDLLYGIMPLYTMLIYYILSYLVQKLDERFLYKCFTFFIIISFIVLITQYTNILNLNVLLNPYYEFISKNNAVDSKVSSFCIRPFGLTGNPTFLTFISYLMYKICLCIKKSKLISILTFLTMLISGGRMILFFAILWEPFEFIINMMRKVHNTKILLKRVFKIICFILLLIGLIIGCIYFIPFLHQEIWNGIAEGWFFQSYSYSYRAEMFNILKEANCLQILFGWLTYNAILQMGITYVDSEYVMRILQFGIIGLTLIYYPLLVFIKRNKFSLESIFLLAICLTFAYSQFTITNYAFIFYITLYMAIINKFSKRKNYGK